MLVVVVEVLVVVVEVVVLMHMLVLVVEVVVLMHMLVLVDVHGSCLDCGCRSIVDVLVLVDVVVVHVQTVSMLITSPTIRINKTKNGLIFISY